jgi:hypothetical protein
VDVSILTDLATKYKAVLLEYPEVFILVFALGCAVTWFVVQTRVGNAKAQVDSKKAEIEVIERHVAFYKARVETLERRPVPLSDIGSPSERWPDPP